MLFIKIFLRLTVYTYILISFIFSSNVLSAQTNVDSLLKILKECPDEKKAKLLNEISSANYLTYPEKRLYYGYEARKFARRFGDDFNLAKAFENIASGYSGISQYDSALIYSDSVFSLILDDDKVVKGDYTLFAGRLFYLKGLVYRGLGTFDSAVVYFNKSREIYSNEGDSIRVANIYTMLGLVATQHGSDYELAVDYYLKALAIGESMNSRDIQSHVCNNLAIIYAEWGNLNKSLEYFLKSYEALKNEDQLSNQGQILSNIGEVYIRLGEYGKAIEYCRKAIEIGETLNDKSGLAYGLNNIGYAYTNLKQYDDAQKSLEKALRISTDINSPVLIINVRKSLSYFYQQKGDFTEALKHLDISQEIAAGSGITIDYLDNYNNYYELYLAQKNYPKALEYYKKFIDIKDSVFSEEKHRQISELETKYETVQIKEKNVLLSKENEVTTLQLKKNRIFLYSILIISFLSILLFAISFMAFRRGQRNKQLMLEKELELKLLELEKKIYSTEIEVQEKERRRFAKDLHDGLGPLLSSLKLYLNKLVTSDLSKSDDLIATTRDIINEAILNTRKIAHDIMPIAVAEQDLIDSVNKFIFRIKKTSGIQFTVESGEETIKLKQPEKLVLYRVITELINNTLKHADADLVTLSVKVLGQKIFIEYTDNGKGFNINDFKPGMGIKNVQERIQSIGGNVEISAQVGQGMKASICLNQ